MTDDQPRSAGEGGGAKVRRALAVFHDEGAGCWPRLCGRPGFRHCFVALNDGRAWIVVDPCSDGTRVSAEVPAEIDLAAHYRGYGYAVVEADLAQSQRRYRLPWAFTCVEAVKRILGIHGWWLWTPHQLYQRLEKDDHGKHLQSAQTESATAAATAADAGGSGGRGGA